MDHLIALPGVVLGRTDAPNVFWMISAEFGIWSLIAVLTAYLCCQLRRWAALLVIALFPTGGTALQDATELVVTLPLLLALVHWIAPSVRALSHSSLKLQLQFGVDGSAGFYRIEKSGTLLRLKAE